MSIIYPWSGRLASTIGQGWFIGRRRTDLSRVLAGDLDAMVVYPRALGSAQILKIYHRSYPVGLAADWEFDEGAGASAIDSSRNGNTATLVDATYVPPAAN